MGELENKMLKLSFAKFMNLEDFPDHAGYELYIVKGARKTLYIGISQRNIWNRWFYSGKCHMFQIYDGSWNGNTSIGVEVAKNMPKSLKWKIELWTLEDCQVFLIKDTRELGWLPGRFDITDIEPLMIRKLNPTFNSTYKRGRGQ